MLNSQVQIQTHDARDQLVNEVHARPAYPCPPRTRISLLLMVVDEGATKECRAHLVALCRRFGQPEPPEDARHHTLDAGAVQVVWERHTELFSYTFFRASDAEDPFTDLAIDAVPQDWVSSAPGALLAAMHLTTAPSAEGLLDSAAAHRAFGRHDFAASRIRGGTATVASDFRMHADGFSRMMLFDSTHDDHVRGRMVQRLLDIETYRLAALLALPVARGAQAALTDLEADVVAMSDRLAAPPHMTNDRDLLQRLSALAGEAEALGARSAYRFAASEAYYRIVLERIGRLREERITGHERIGRFMDRRLAPAMHTCEAVARRQRTLTERIQRATQLLATRVDVAVEEQNARLLASMDRRAESQIRLQETVEGLSTIAITYYAVGLVGYLAEGLNAAGMRFLNPALVAALSTVIIFAGVWIGVRQVRQRIWPRKDGA